MKIKHIEAGFAEVESGRLKRRVNIQMLKEANIGDYVIVHAGFAIERLNPKSAEDTLRLISQDVL